MRMRWLLLITGLFPWKVITTPNLGSLTNFARFEVPSDMMDVYRKDYIDLYVDYMGNIVLKEDLSRPYITSSPSNGLKTIIDGWLSLKPQDEKYGDSELSFLCLCLQICYKFSFYFSPLLQLFH